MDKTTADDVMRELTMLLLYLSRFTERDRFSDSREFRAWKGYDFDVLNELDEKEYIYQGSHRSKSVYLTEVGIEKAQELLEKYNVADWEKKK